MNMNALTWVVVIYLALVVFRAVRRGFLRSVFSMAFLLVVVLVMAVGTPAVTKMCSESQYITEYVRRQTAAVIASAGSGSGSSVSLANASTPEEVGTAVIALAMGTDSVRDAAAGEIGSVIIRIIAAVITFVIALLIGIVIQIIIVHILRRRGVSALDHILGLPIGLLKGLVGVWLALGLIQLLSFTSPFDGLARQITVSPVLTFITTHNLLSAILAKLVTAGI